MTVEEKKIKIESLKILATQLKKDAEYYNAMQNALKLVLNGSYGAFAAGYFVLFNGKVAASITAQGRDLTKTMDRVNEDYWYNKWHLDTELHEKLGIIGVTQIDKSEHVSIYADTDSLFVSFKPAVDHCTWENLVFDMVDFLDEKFIILSKEPVSVNNTNCIGQAHNLNELRELLNSDYELLLFDGHMIKNRDLNSMINEGLFKSEIKWNWSNELDLIQGIDYFRYGGYFKQCLEDYAAGFGVENKEDFELEKISESMINIAKKKYIQNIVHEDGIDFERLKYIFPKGVELVRSSTPLFARDKIVGIIEYLFTNPDTFNIKELLKLVKNLRKEFELADIDDKSLPIKFVTGAHFAVKCSAYYNYLLTENRQYQEKYEFIKSGTKIKYYVCKDKSINDMFAYMRGSYPHEFAPEIDYDTQFEKAILSPINSIIEPLGMPEITKRLSVVVDIFSNFGGSSW